jgi:hypothetical protein
MEKKYVFFLGGYDAEMITIKEILDQRGLSYFDKRLKWGAALSEYKDELNGLPGENIPVFVELRLDIPYPENAVVVDHHNERAGKNMKTSLEQVADLLGVRLNRRQQLVSANDRGHIPAMEELGASPDEINEIRGFDRRCQGVTDKDEKLAVRTIRENLEQLGPGAFWITNLTEKSSPVMDRLYGKFKHLFITAPSKDFSYFGTGKMIDKLESLYRDEQKSRPDIIFWKGGNLPDFGFFGANILLEKEKIIQVYTRDRQNSTAAG